MGGIQYSRPILLFFLLFLLPNEQNTKSIPFTLHCPTHCFETNYVWHAKSICLDTMLEEIVRISSRIPDQLLKNVMLEYLNKSNSLAFHTNLSLNRVMQSVLKQHVHTGQLNVPQNWLLFNKTTVL